jgi:Na+/H+ antiporter NhaC
MTEPSILSLLPSVLTIVVAIVTRKVILSLGIGVFLGMTIVEGFNPVTGLVSVFEKGIFLQFTEGANAQIVVLICVIGGFVRQLDSSGGMLAFAARITRKVSSPAKAQIAVLLTGVAIFFTDSGNSLILGPLFRPVFDKLKICREKLAFILDATSSPVCVLVPFIGWGVYIMSLIDQGYEQVGQKVHSLSELLAALPFQFYPLLALSSVPLFALAGRDFGPMQRAQCRRWEESTEDATNDKQPEKTGAGATAVILPLVVVLV